MPRRLHRRLRRPDVEVDSPLIDCRLVNLSTSGLAIETSVGLRLGVPYPFRLRHAEQSVSTEAEVRWCRLVRNETDQDGESRPVYRAGAAFVEWQSLSPDEPQTPLEEEIDSAIDRWIEGSRKPQSNGSERTIVQQAPYRRTRPAPLRRRGTPG